MSIIIVGFSSTDRVPGFYGETVYGAGGVGALSQPMYLLLVGNMTTGTSTPDASVDDVLSETDAIAKYGTGSELHRMARVAFRYPGVRVKAAPVAEAGGAAAATITVTVTGTWTAPGSLIYRLAGEQYTANITATNTIQEAATAVANAFNGRPECPATAAVGAGPGFVVTLTAKQKGPRGNDLILCHDDSQVPSGLSQAFAGGASVGLTGTFLSGGSGLDSVVNVLAVLYPGFYQRVAFAQGDATNVALVKTYLASKAGPLEGRTEHAVVGATGTLSASQSIAQTTWNDQRGQVVWLANGETPAAEVSASMAAMRVQAEQDQPNSGYDNQVLLGVRAQESRADWVGHTTAVSALDNSLTPLYSQEDGTVTVVRAITTHSKSGSNFDYSTLDTAQAVVPDFARLTYKLNWTTSFAVANPYVRPDPADTEPEPPQGVCYPRLWGSELLSMNQDMEKAKILTQTTLAQNAPVTDFDFTANRIMAIAPVVPLPINHQVGVSVRQVNLTRT